MRHQSIEQIGAVATVAKVDAPPMSRRDRLERWADLLRRSPHRPLRALSWVEFYAERERALLRGDDTPVSVAYADPELRAAGLAGDTLGEAEGFFQLSSDEMHYLVCDCHFNGRMDAEGVARRIEALAEPNAARRFWMRLRAQ